MPLLLHPSGTSPFPPPGALVEEAEQLLASPPPPTNASPLPQALVEGAEQLPNLGMFEQGSGKVSLAGSR